MLLKVLKLSIADFALNIEVDDLIPVIDDYEKNIAPYILHSCN